MSTHFSLQQFRLTKVVLMEYVPMTIIKD